MDSGYEELLVDSSGFFVNAARTGAVQKVRRDVGEKMVLSDIGPIFSIHEDAALAPPKRIPLERSGCWQ